MEFNIDPYNDDFQQNALDNNYMRILFKPGRAVQARELTQIQSILQNQIKQFGDHIFQDGSPVIGGNMTLDNKVKYLKLEETFNNTDIEIEDFDQKVVRNASGTVQAKVLATYFPAEGTPTLMVKYITGNEFADGEALKIIGTSTQAQLISSSANGNGTVCSINEGVFYVDGFFVQVADQTVVVSAYNTVANVKIGLEINDDIVDSDIDTTLLDPAQGSFNYQAPGADRYQFNLSLSTRPLDTVVDESRFFELMRVESGMITKQVKYPIYSELEKTLARRTYDESGDYTVRPFRASILDAANANNYIIAIEPGKAYVKGFEFETIGTFKMEVPKPRSVTDTKELVDVDVDLSYGNYILTTSLRGTGNGFFNIAAHEKVDIHLVDSSNVLATGTFAGTANTQIYQNTKIGTARVVNFVRYAADLFNSSTDSNGVYQLYLSEIDIRPKVVKAQSAPTFAVIANAASLNVSSKFSNNANAYQNVTATILPIKLTAIGNVNVANIYAGSYRVNANVSGVYSGNVFKSANVTVGNIVKVGDDVREVIFVDAANDFFTVNTAFEKTIVGTNNTTNPLEIYIQQSYTQNTTGQTRTVASSKLENGNVILFWDRPFDNNGIPDNNTVVQFNYDIKHAESFVSGLVVNNVHSTIANASMNVSLFSKLQTGEATIEDRLRKSLIFKLPANYVKRGSLDNNDYNYVKYIYNKANTPSANIFTISSPGDFTAIAETIPWADATSSIQDNLIVIVRNSTDSGLTPNGQVLQLTSANVTSLTPSSLTFDTYLPHVDRVDVMMTVKGNDAEQKIRLKTLHSNTTYTGSSTNYTYPLDKNGDLTVTVTNLGEVANINTSQGFIWLTNPTFNNIRPGDSISLFVPDVVKVNKILKGNTTNVPDANNVEDITSHFLIDYGQRDDIYDHAKIILKSGYDSPNAKILVHVDYYEHVYTTSNVSFFSVDSYPETQYNSGSIPIYTSSTGDVFNLRDCLDFRATRKLGLSDGTIQVPNIPGPAETAELSVDYYLPRIDKLVLSKDKEFRILQGKSAAQPLPPDDVDDAMTLYTIKLPPYVADIREIRTVYNENRRFTMKDISSIEKRLQKVEFFVSLNNVEKLAMADKTQYEDGTEKEKYGIVGENFTNFNIADFKNGDFNAALEGGFLLPPMNITPLGLKNVDNTGNTAATVTTNRKTLSLQYTETPAITQGLAANKSVSVQPFLFGQFNGTMSLSPETDYWVAEHLKPEIITVPERIIEHHTVIRETIIEPAPPVTITNIFPTTNVVTQIILNPNDTLPTLVNEDRVIVVPPNDPPPVIPPVPVPPEPVLDDPWQPVYCPAPWMGILLTDDSTIPAGELKVGMMVRTQHEKTLEWGAYKVTNIESIQDAERLEIEFNHVNFVCSPDHKFYCDGEWIAASKLQTGDLVGTESDSYEVLGISVYPSGEVIKITVEDAHTYICEGILSHNKPPSIDVPDPFNFPIVFDPDPWWSIIPRNPFMFGGQFDGSSWFPAVLPSPIETQPIIESSIPTQLPPIDLSYMNTVEDAGGGRGDLEFGVYKYREN